MNFRDLENFFSRAMQPIKNRVSLMVGRAVVAAVKDSSGIQSVQLHALAGESLDNIPHLQNFGFTSNPPVGSEGVILALGGNRDNLVIVSVDNRDVRKSGLQPGESAQYTDDGTYLLMKKGGEVDLVLKKLKAQNDSDELITVLSDLIQAIIDARTETAIGPMPLLNVAKPFPAIKARLDTFKV